MEEVSLHVEQTVWSLQHLAPPAFSHLWPLSVLQIAQVASYRTNYFMIKQLSLPTQPPKGDPDHKYLNWHHDFLFTEYRDRWGYFSKLTHVLSLCKLCDGKYKRKQGYLKYQYLHSHSKPKSECRHDFKAFLCKHILLYMIRCIYPQKIHQIFLLLEFVAITSQPSRPLKLPSSESTLYSNQFSPTPSVLTWRVLRFIEGGLDVMYRRGLILY